MGGFGSMESITVGGNVVFEGFGVDGEVGFFVEAFESKRVQYYREDTVS